MSFAEIKARKERERKEKEEKEKEKKEQELKKEELKNAHRQVTKKTVETTTRRPKKKWFQLLSEKEKDAIGNALTTYVNLRQNRNKRVRNRFATEITFVKKCQELLEELLQDKK